MLPIARGCHTAGSTAAAKLMAPLVQKDASKHVEGLIRTIDALDRAKVYRGTPPSVTPITAVVLNRRLRVEDHRQFLLIRIKILH